MTALLALLAVAGYQNRDKIAEMLKGLGGGSPGQGQPGQTPGQTSDLGGLLASLGGAGGVGGLLSGGLRELMEAFGQSDKKDVAESWVGRGPNKEIGSDDLRKAIGPDVLEEISERTGLSQAEVLSRLSRELPTAIDRYTPEGRLPAA
jgi:uncharacterized protein YidB (DUF937 family)